VRWQERAGIGPGDAIGAACVRSFVRDVLPLINDGCVVEYSDPDGSLAKEIREEIEAQSNVEAANF
jgi:hypothetical protein